MAEEKVSKAKVKELASGAPTSGRVTIKPKDPKKTGSITIRDYRESGTNEHRPFVDAHGNHRVVRIKRPIHLDMSELDNQLTYNQVIKHPEYIGGQTPILVVVNHEQEAEDYIDRLDLTSEANNIVRKLKGEAIKDFARVLLIPFNVGSSESAVKRKVYEMCEEKPQFVIDSWEDKEREIKLFVHKSLEAGIFAKRNQRWMYGSEVMGTTFESAVEWVKINEDLVPSIKKQLK